MSDRYKTGINLSYEVADGITLLCLQDHYHYLTKELKEYRENPEKKYLHPVDAFNSEFNLIPALKTIIEYYGGDVDEWKFYCY